MFVGEGVFLVWWVVDVSVCWVLGVEWVDFFVFVVGDVEYWDVDLVELFGFYCCFDYCVDFFVVWLEVF